MKIQTDTSLLRVLMRYFLCALILAACLANTARGQSLIAHWPLDELSGAVAFLSGVSGIKPVGSDIMLSIIPTFRASLAMSTLPRPKLVMTFSVVIFRPIATYSTKTDSRSVNLLIILARPSAVVTSGILFSAFSLPIDYL